MRIAVVGIGESLRGDDGAGPEAVRLWQQQYPSTASRADVLVISPASPGLELLESIQGADGALFIDSVLSGAAPGTLHHLDLECLPAFSSDSKSSHGWGLAETLRLRTLLAPAAGKAILRIIGIEAAACGLGKGLSETVRLALPAASAAIQEQAYMLLSQ